MSEAANHNFDMLGHVATDWARSFWGKSPLLVEQRHGCFARMMPYWMTSAIPKTSIWLSNLRA